MTHRILLVLALVAVSAAGLGGQPAGQAPSRYDLLIHNAHVYDGNGNPWILADVGIRGDRIQAVGTLAGASAARTIDAAGLALAPGFIDVHSHAGGGLGTEALKHGQPVLAQGITTVV